MRGKLGFVLIPAGLVLAVFLPNLEVFWFTGRAFGILLVALGAYELFEHRGGRRPKGIIEDLRDEIVGSPRKDDNDRADRDPNDWDTKR